MTATIAPTMTLNVTEAAAEEIKKFMVGEEGLPETAGLRVRVIPGGCSGFQYSLNIEEESRQGDYILDEHGVRLFVHSLKFKRLRNPRDGACACALVCQHSSYAEEAANQLSRTSRPLFIKRC